MNYYKDPPTEALRNVMLERGVQQTMHGDHHDDWWTPSQWSAMHAERLAKVAWLSGFVDPDRVDLYRHRLVQAGALYLAHIEAIDRAQEAAARKSD